MTVLQYAIKYKVSPRTVYRWIEEKRVQAKKILVETWDVEDIKVEKKPRYKLPPKFKYVIKK